MNIREVIERVGEAKLREALEKDDAASLKQTFADGGVEITDEQLDYIAGGIRMFNSTPDSYESCMFPGMSCMPS